MKSKTVYGFDKSGSLPVVALHTFEITTDNQLSHLIDGTPRATIPPEGWADYAKQYPEAQDIIDAMTIKPEAAPAVPMAEQIADLQAKLAALQAEPA